MNNKGAFRLSLWLLIGFLLLVSLVVLIEPLESILTNVIGVDGMDCSTPKDGYRGSCIVLTGALLWFIFGIGYAIIKGLVEKARGR
jgi:hypothetical protein